MSSRSKEKVAAAIRKLFKGSSDKVDATASAPAAATVAVAAAAAAAVAVDPNGNAAAALPAGTAAQLPAPPASPASPATTAAATAAAAQASIANSNNNNNNNNATNGPTDSPGKRLRRQDNKVAPATRKVGGSANGQQPDFSIRARRLMKEYKEIQKSQNRQNCPIFTVELVNDNLYEWHARLHVVDPDSKLAKDMAEMNIPFILLHLVFPDNFPFAPPFMRVVEPRIEKGFVMEGGAICMELLTPRGWASAYTVEAVLMQFAASLVKGQGRIVRKTKSSKEFSRRTAEEAFRSLVKTHEKYGWVTPSLSDG